MEKNENLNIEGQSIDDDFYFHKPEMLKRIKSMIIDGVVIIILMYLAFRIFDSTQSQSETGRKIAMLFIILYEPIFTSINRTIGQKIMGLRVRNFSTFKNFNEKKNINILYSLIRYIAKLFLGWLSLITIHSNKFGRAIHDITGNSVMTNEK